MNCPNKSAKICKKCGFVGSKGNYRSGTASSGRIQGAYFLNFDDGTVSAGGQTYRCYGLSVRPVRLVAIYSTDNHLNAAAVGSYLV